MLLFLSYLPPYSPDFDPIEETFSKKNILRSTEARTCEALVGVMSEAISVVIIGDASDFLGYCGYGMSV